MFFIFFLIFLRLSFLLKDSRLTSETPIFSLFGWKNFLDRWSFATVNGIFWEDISFNFSKALFKRWIWCSFLRQQILETLQFFLQNSQTVICLKSMGENSIILKLIVTLENNFNWIGNIEFRNSFVYWKSKWYRFGIKLKQNQFIIVFQFS